MRNRRTKERDMKDKLANPQDWKNLKKAKELIDSFRPFAHDINSDNEVDLKLAKASAKQCALICVDEIIKSNPTLPQGEPKDVLDPWQAIEYWEKVKEQIKQL